MAKIKDVTLTQRDITLTLAFDRGVYGLSKALPMACAEAGIDYIGDRISIDRIKQTLVKYNKRLYFLYDYTVCGTAASALFKYFIDDLSSTNPISEYSYYIDYRNPYGKDNHLFQLYFKADELKEAESLQQELGADFASLEKI